MMRRKDSATSVRKVPSSQEQHGGQRDGSLSLTVLGVCSGTGLGHLDCALVRFDQTSPSTPLHIRLQQVSPGLLPRLSTSYSSYAQFDRIPVPSSAREPIDSYLRGERHRSPLAHQPNELLGRLFSVGINTFCQRHDLNPASIDLVGTHSEALRYLAPQSSPDGGREHPLHWNSLIAAETGISTVFDYTINERTAVGSRIHPTAYVDRVFLRHPTKFRVCLNIDEITNLSFIPPLANNDARNTISRDCGPGSLLINYAMRYCTSNAQSDDRDGDVGATGKINQSIIDQFLNTRDYLRQSPRMNIASEMFGDHEAQQLIDECLYSNMSEADTIATITRATAHNILNQYNRLLQLFFPPGQKVDELFICGPSARNANIIDYLESELPESVITKPLHDIGIPSDAHEAACYAYLAFEAVLGQATQVAGSSKTPGSTYSSLDVVGARVIPGNGWINLLDRILKFSGGLKIPIATDIRIASNLETTFQGLELR